MWDVLVCLGIRSALKLGGVHAMGFGSGGGGSQRLTRKDRVWRLGAMKRVTSEGNYVGLVFMLYVCFFCHRLYVFFYHRGLHLKFIKGEKEAGCIKEHYGLRALNEQSLLWC